jgi:hypothetical protein
MRLVCIGHPRARFDDLLLDFRDQENRATDTVLWLRNGGGKSSLLNLFYSVVRPRQTDFLGGKGGEEHRRLADYVQPEDQAVVACEWELDGDASLLDGDTSRYLTVAFHEHKSSSPADGSSVGPQRLFLAAEVHADVPELTLEGLPLTTQAEDGRPMRRSLANFRRFWGKLRAMYPGSDVFLTEKQADWARQLESRGIDTQLFGYQLDMNSREGGVTQLFTFPDADSFVDFLLQTAFDPQDAERVRQQVQTFRTELLRRHRELQPDSELCEGLLERMSPFQEIAGTRNAIRKRLAEFERHRGGLAVRLTSLQAKLAETLGKHEEDARGFVEMEQQQQDVSRSLESRAVTLRHHAIMSRLTIARSEHVQRKAELDSAAEQVALWRAAVPLADEIKFKEEARAYRDQVQERQSEHAPLIERLADAAGSLVARLNSEANGLRGQAAQCQRESAAHRNSAKQRRQQALQSASLASAARTEARGLEQRLTGAEGHWKRLQRDGVARKSEGPLSAQTTIARLVGEIDAVRKESADLETQRTENNSQRQSISRQREAAQVSQRDAETERKRLGRLVAEMSDARARLASNATLLALLQVEAADVDRVCGEAISLAKDQRRVALEAILDLRLGRADDERALGFLRDHGRMPPSHDVLAVLDVLRGRGIACWSGWEYLEANVPRDQRRSVVRRQPHLVSGVIVAGVDTLGSLPDNADLGHLGGPVTIAAADHMLSPVSSHQYRVWGPTDDSLFDSGAAGRVEAETSQRIDKSRESEGRREQWRESVECLLKELEHYGNSYPAGWLEDTLAMQEQLREEVSQLSEELAALSSRDAGLQEGLDQLAKKAKDLHKRELLLCDAHRRATDFYEQHGQHLVSWQEKKRELEQEALKATAKQENLGKEADEHERLSGASDASDRRLTEQATAIERERDGVRHARRDPAMPTDMPLDSLRATYRTLLDEYDEKIGAEALERLAEQRDRDAEDARRKFEKVRAPGTREEDVVAALRSLPCHVPVEDKKQQVEEDHWTAKQLLGNVSARIGRLEEALHDLEPARERLRIDTFDEAVAAGMTPDQAEEAAIRADAESAKALSDAQEAGKLAQESRERAWHTQAEVEKCRAVAQRLDDVRGHHADLLNEAGIRLQMAEHKEAPGGLEPAETLDLAVGQLACELMKEKQAWQDINRSGEQHLRQLHDWCRQERFVKLPEGIAARFAQFTAMEVETRVDYYREHLVTRLQQIKADLEEADRQRTIVVDAVMSSVEHALELLKRIARLSKLPDTVAGGGRHFLEITTSAPENPVERRGRVAELIDEVIQSGQLESGLELVQRAARRVARPIRVRVLHPDMDSSGSRVPIHQMANFSGGERLTGAILLYCALARLRSQQLGVTGKRTSVLLLDNPIGTVSRVRYLDLQREVARALGVQLIYATGVHDIDAVASLPNIIRLRNARRDVRSGRRVVELDPDPDLKTNDRQDSIVDAVRVHTSPSGPERTTAVPGSGDE